MEYLGPGNIAADLDAGRVAGFSLLWLTMISYIIGSWIYGKSAKLGIVTQKSMGKICRI